MPKRSVSTAAAASSQLGTSTHTRASPVRRVSSSSGRCRPTSSPDRVRISTSAVSRPPAWREAPSDEWEGGPPGRSRAHHSGMAEELPAAPREIGERAANVLAPESALFEDLDAAGFGDAMRQVLRAGATHPLVPGQAALRLTADLAQVPAATMAQWMGRPVDPPVPVDPKDRRFADVAWQENPLFYALRLV